MFSTKHWYSYHINIVCGISLWLLENKKNELHTTHEYSFYYLKLLYEQHVLIPLNHLRAVSFQVYSEAGSLELVMDISYTLWLI
jgi:hypothetical protein